MDNYNIDIEKFNELGKYQKWTMLTELHDEEKIKEILKNNISDVREYEVNLGILILNSNNKYNLEKFFENEDIENISQLIGFILDRKNDIVEKYYYEELINKIRQIIVVSPEKCKNPEYYEKELIKIFNEDREILNNVFYKCIENNSLSFFNLDTISLISEEEWNKAVKKYQNDSNRLLIILDEYLIYKKDITELLNDMNADDIFFYLLNSKKLDEDSLKKYMLLCMNEIKNIQNDDIFKNIILKILNSKDADLYLKLFNEMNKNMIERFDNLFEDSNVKFYDLLSERANEELKQLINVRTDNELISNARKLIENNEIEEAQELFLRVKNKSLCKDLYMFFISNSDVRTLGYEEMFMTDDEILILLYLEKNKDIMSVNITILYDMLDILITKKMPNAALFLSGFDKEDSFCKKNADVPVLVYLYNNGITNEYIEELMKNYNRLKEVNAGINPNNPQFTIDLLNSDIFKKYSPQFIVDILEYDGRGIETLIANKNSSTLLNLEKYLKNNDIYSRKIIYRFLNHYDEISPLLDNLVINNYTLTDIEKRSLLEYLNDIIIKNNINITNITELQNYKSIKIKKVYDKFEECDNLLSLKEIIYSNLFSASRIDNIDKLISNVYLQNEMLSMGILDDFDLALIEIIKDVDSITLSESLDESKQKYRNIVEKGISLSNKYGSLLDKITNYYESLIQDRMKNEQLNNIQRAYKEYEGEKIPIIELNGENFTFLVHSISGNDTSVKNINGLVNNITENPNIWNETDVVSTISCSLISDKNLDYITNNVVLGFSKIPSNSLVGMNTKDGFTVHGYNAFKPGMRNNNLQSPEMLSKNTKVRGYNEVAIYRKNNQLEKFDGKIQPTFILAYGSEPTPKELKFAKYFGVPIVKINKNEYERRNKEKTEKYINGDIEKFDMDDAREILYLKEFTEEESINLIMKYLDEIEISQEEYIELYNGIQKLLIDYYISDVSAISDALKVLEEHKRDYQMEEKNGTLK